MVNDEAASTRKPTDAAQRRSRSRPPNFPTITMSVAGAATFAAGSGLGWCSRNKVLEALTAPFQIPGRILESWPSPTQVFGWYLLVTMTAGLLAALPFLSWLAVRYFAPGSCPVEYRIHRRSDRLVIHRRRSWPMGPEPRRAQGSSTFHCSTRCELGRPISRTVGVCRGRASGGCDVRPRLSGLRAFLRACPSTLCSLQIRSTLKADFRDKALPLAKAMAS